MALFRRRAQAPPPIPTLQVGFEQALDMVLRRGMPSATSGSVHVSRTANGCNITAHSQAPLGLAPILMQRATDCLRGTSFQVTLRVQATVPQSWHIASGIQRRTHPGCQEIHAQLDTISEARAWLGQDASLAFRSAGSSRWVVGVVHC